MRVWARIEDHQLIETLQTRGLRQGLRFTKSQIVRAGLRALDAMTPGEFAEAVEQSEPLKPRDHGSDVIQRSLKSENRYSTLFLPEDTGSGRTQSRSAAGARVPLRSAAFRPTALRPIVRREPRGHQRLACPLPDPLPAPHKPALRRSPAPAPRSSGVSNRRARTRWDPHSKGTPRRTSSRPSSWLWSSRVAQRRGPQSCSGPRR